MVAQTRFAWVGLSWSRSRLGTQRSPWAESIVRGVKAVGCKAHRSPLAHRHAQALTAHLAPLLPQLYPEAARILTAFVAPEGLDHQRLLGRCWLRLLPSGVADGWHDQHLAEPLHGVAAALGGEEAVAAHGSGVCEKLAREAGAGFI